MLSRLLGESAERNRARPALIVGPSTISYGELFEYAGRLSAALAAADRNRGICAVIAGRALTGFAGILGTLGAGMAYLPINPSTPPARARAALRLGEPCALICDRAGFNLACALSLDMHERLTIVMPEQDAVPAELRGSGHRIVTRADLGKEAPLAEPAGDDPDALAYLLFTSGSTGAPKGVQIRRRNVLAYLSAIQSLYPISAEDRCTQLFDLTFDLSAHDMFATWLAGACLVVPNNAQGLFAVDSVRRHKLTLWFSVPSLAALLSRGGKLQRGSMPSLRRAFFCGERFPISVAKAVAEAAPKAEIVNLYGPTEATIAITHYAWGGGDLGPGIDDLPIGRPLPDQDALIIGPTGEPVPDGTVGEIHLRGSQVAEGYWKDPSETAARFRQLALPGMPTQRWYATGDLARKDPAHGLLFRGRRDEQVKIRGMRVELGEIEAVVRRAAAGAQAIAVPWPLDAHGNASGVIVYVEKGAATAADVQRCCADYLPGYMIPQAIIEIDRLPLNGNGKLDRKAVLEMHRCYQAAG